MECFDYSVQIKTFSELSWHSEIADVYFLKEKNE
jgi:hypothetical protein